MRKQRERQATRKQAPLKPLQGHYGLEYALAHLGEDLSSVFKHLEAKQRSAK